MRGAFRCPPKQPNKGDAMIRKRARQCKWLARSLRRPWDKATTLFGDLTDFRKSRGKRWSLELVLTLAFLSMCTCLLSLRGMEEMSSNMSSVVQTMFGVGGTVSDNTFGRVLALLNWKEVQMRLWLQVRAMRERHQLVHDQLPLKTAALDGKTTSSGKKRMSRFAQKSNHKVKDNNGKERTETRFKLHQLRLVCTSVRQKVCFWQHPVGSKNNEQSGARVMLKEVFRLDKAGEMFQLLTFDAMFLFYDLTRMIQDDGRYFLGRIKDDQPGLIAEAEKWLRPDIDSIAQYESGLVKDHKFWKLYRIWRTNALADCVTSTHIWDTIQEGWCVEVIRYTRIGKGRGRKAKLVEHDRSVGYFATNLNSATYPLSAAQCLELVLSHWSIEDDCFNALDVQWKEDTHAYATTGEATLNRSIFLMMAYNACQMMRRHKEKGRRWDGKSVWQTWDKTFKEIDRSLTAFYHEAVVRSEKMLVV